MNENVSKAIEMLEVHQLKKLVARAKAGQELNRADLQLLNRLSMKLAADKSHSRIGDAAQASSQKKSTRGRPANATALTEKIQRQALEELLARQARNEKLTGADYAFLEKMKLATGPQKGASNILQLPQQKETRAQRMARLEEHALAIIENALKTEKGVALATFVKMAREAASATVVAESETLNISFTSSGEDAKEA